MAAFSATFLSKSLDLEFGPPMIAVGSMVRKYPAWSGNDPVCQGLFCAAWMACRIGVILFFGMRAGKDS
jgi:hypothetical protein